MSAVPSYEGSNISNHREEWELDLWGEIADIHPHIQALHEIGKVLDFVIFSLEANSDRFVQFRLILSDDYDKIVQLSLPHSAATDSYRSRILNMVIARDLAVESYEMKTEERSMKMDHIIFDDDVLGAADFAKAVFTQVFDAVHDTRIEISRGSGDDHPSLFSKSLQALGYLLGYALGYCSLKIRGIFRK